MSEWRTIDSAPRDGTEILIWCPNLHSQLVASYNDGRTDRYRWDTLDGPSYSVEAPTHWMPLPEPPK